jgi:hypothetical protein
MWIAGAEEYYDQTWIIKENTKLMSLKIIDTHKKRKLEGIN